MEGVLIKDTISSPIYLAIHQTIDLTIDKDFLAAALTQSRAAQPPPDPVFCAPRFVWPLRTSTATVSELLSRRAATLLQLCPRYLRSLRVTEGQRAPRAHGTVKLQHHPRSRGRLGTVVLSPRQQKLLLAPQKEGQKPAGLKSRDQYVMIAIRRQIAVRRLLRHRPPPGTGAQRNSRRAWAARPRFSRPFPLLRPARRQRLRAARV